MDILFLVMIKGFLKLISVRSIVVLTLVFGALYLAIIDAAYRPFFADLAKFGLGGYFAQLIPKEKLRI